MSVKSKVLRGVTWTTLSKVAVTLIQVLQLSILSRFLAPADFGLMAIMMVVIGFSQIFMDMGISNALIHRQEISHTQLSSLYWLNIASGVCLCGVMILVAPAIAAFYEVPQLTGFLVPLSFTFLLVALGNQYRVLSQKELLFSLMAKVEVTAASASFVVAVLLAANDFGVYSLVYAALASAGTSSLIFLIIGLRRHHRPALVYKHKELKGYLGFGLFQMGEKSINYFNTQFDVLLIGKLLGPEATGIYHIARTLSLSVVRVINPIVTKVTLPVLAQLQNDTQALKGLYLKTLSYLSVIACPVFAAIALLAEPLIHILFGSRWGEAVPVLRVLAAYSMLRSMGNPVGTLLLARGRADMGFYWNLSLVMLFPMAIYAGSHWGLVGVAVAQLALVLSLKIPMWRCLVWPLCGAGLQEYLKPFLRPLIMVAVSVIVALPFLFADDYYVQIAMVLFAGGCTYVVLLLRFGGEFVQVLKGFVAPRQGLGE